MVGVCGSDHRQVPPAGGDVARRPQTDGDRADPSHLAQQFDPSWLSTMQQPARSWLVNVAKQALEFHDCQASQWRSILNGITKFEASDEFVGFQSKQRSVCTTKLDGQEKLAIPAAQPVVPPSHSTPRKGPGNRTTVSVVGESTPKHNLSEAYIDSPPPAVIGYGGESLCTLPYVDTVVAAEASSDEGGCNRNDGDTVVLSHEILTMLDSDESLMEYQVLSCPTMDRPVFRRKSSKTVFQSDLLPRSATEPAPKPTKGFANFMAKAAQKFSSKKATKGDELSLKGDEQPQISNSRRYKSALLPPPAPTFVSERSRPWTRPRPGYDQDTEGAVHSQLAPPSSPSVRSQGAKPKRHSDWGPNIPLRLQTQLSPDHSKQARQQSDPHLMMPSTPICGTCSCSSFTNHPFKSGQCTNCFHRHC